MTANLIGSAVIIGSRGGIGAALADALNARGGYDRIIGLSRSSDPSLDLTDEASIRAAAAILAEEAIPLRLIIIATGLLQGQGISPEKSLRELNADALTISFAINAVGPALVLKHFLPLLPREGRSACVALSARVGSINDNRLGGWYGYRASKAALNQLMRTAAIEIGRSRPEAICAVLHPGTVATPLSDPFIKSGLDVQSPAEAADRLLDIIAALTPADNGCFLDHVGRRIEW